MTWLLFALVALLFAAIAIPNIRKGRTNASANGCLNNLRQIDGAKDQWAMQYHKTQTDTPTWDDLVGTDKDTNMRLRYVNARLSCPSGGTYTIGSMAQKPRCSVPDHTLR